MPSTNTYQKAALQFINDNSPTRAEMIAALPNQGAWIIRVLPLKMWGFATYTKSPDQWSITAAGITELAS